MYLRILLIFFLALGMLLQPHEILSAALAGVALWWRFVLPALLPFFILSELLIGSGFVRFLSLLLEPLMRPVFRLPGAASFVVAMGYTSGFPMGAVLTNRLYQEGELTRQEAEHLITFTNNPSPGFMFGAVAAGMIGQSSLGPLLAASIYLANLIVGILLRFSHPQKAYDSARQSLSFRQAWRETALRQKENQEPIGQLLGDSIRHSINTVLAVGGFLVFFAVVIRLLSVFHIFPSLAILLHLIFPFYAAPGWEALLSGTVEMTIGCQNTAAAFVNISQKVELICFLMGWGGLSVFAQVAGFSDRKLRLKSYILGRFLHAFLALGLSRLFLRFADIPSSSFPLSSAQEFLWPDIWRFSSQMFLLTLSTLFAFLILRNLFIKIQRSIH